VSAPRRDQRLGRARVASARSTLTLAAFFRVFRVTCGSIPVYARSHLCPSRSSSGAFALTGCKPATETGAAPGPCRPTCKPQRSHGGRPSPAGVCPAQRESDPGHRRGRNHQCPLLLLRARLSAHGAGRQHEPRAAPAAHAPATQPQQPGQQRRAGNPPRVPGGPRPGETPSPVVRPGAGGGVVFYSPIVITNRCASSVMARRARTSSCHCRIARHPVPARPGDGVQARRPARPVAHRDAGPGTERALTPERLQAGFPRWPGAGGRLLDTPDRVRQSRLTMKTATVRDLRNHFPRVAAWIAEGQPVDITRAARSLRARARRVRPAARARQARHPRAAESHVGRPRVLRPRRRRPARRGIGG